MSGDVFGNGMLLSRHIRLVAAFDHRHVRPLAPGA
jgi:NAD-specific glutamate dehydrogenase